ncbi:UVI-1 protein [Colletotrichum truncatum]|uniref:UVI-1 protein n=1 Tax=Colletotrichum truncatum TaxID=5467 RepID=A0ACC3YKX6_COLTU|nr:UVI-1 protein [Colletotrichum truncatum]KAF6797091.1 UVI-1 protein [Colletotrichum truncatum]
MRFSILKLAVAALAVGTDFVQSAITPAEMETNIKMLTQKSQALQAPAQSISLINGPLIVVGLGPFPQIIAGFSDIIATVTVALAQMQGSAPVPAGAASTAIFNAFREFVRVHQVLLNILIGKAGLFNTVPIIGAPVAGILRQLEAIVDTVALSIIALVESRANDLRDEASKLSGTITIAINSYNGLTIG